MVSVEWYSTLDISGKQLLLILSPSLYLKLDIFIYALRRDVPGSKVTWPVLPNKNFSARSTNMVEEN
jgi:hypothetical protein